MTGQKIITKDKYCRGIAQVREIQSSRKKKDNAVSFLENGLEKEYISSSPQPSETNPNTIYKPDKQNVYEIDSFDKFNFPQYQNNCSHIDY